MYTNASCTIYSRDGGRIVFEQVYCEASKGMLANKKLRESSDGLLLIIPTNQKLDIQNEDIVFIGIVPDIPLNELKNQYDFYVVKDVTSFLFGKNPHYEITGG